MSLATLLVVGAAGIIVAYQAIIGPTNPTGPQGRKPEPSASAIEAEKKRIEACRRIKDIKLKLKCIAQAGYSTRIPSTVKPSEAYNPPA